MKLKNKHGCYALVIKDNEGAPLYVEHFADARKGEYALVLETYGQVGLTRKKALLFAEAIQKALS